MEFVQVISPTLYAMMVLMAVAITMATAPVLRLLVPEAPGEGVGSGHPMERGGAEDRT
jgi:hypothetical protein